VLLTVNVSA
jgi:hypothetical protein